MISFFVWSEKFCPRVLDTLLLCVLSVPGIHTKARSSRSSCVRNERFSLTQISAEACEMEKVLLLSSRVEGMQHLCCS